MNDAERWHQFLCDGRSWAVARRTAKQSGQTGLDFQREGERRFLMFTRGALPTDRELESLAEEVLCVLLQRATQ